MRRAAILAALGASLIAADFDAALAQAYPDRNITLIINTGVGGTGDIIPRVLGEGIAKYFGKPVVPENRPGASGNLGFQLTKAAPPDGYRVLGTSMSVAINPFIFSKAGYEPKDLAPIAKLGLIQNALVGHPSLPAKTLKELVEHSKTTQLYFAYAGGTSRGLMELIMKATGLKAKGIQYPGMANGVLALLKNEVQLVVTGIPNIVSQVNNNELRPYAVQSAIRSPQMAGVPTVAEAGWPDFDGAVDQWFGLFAPRDTPRPILERLNAAVLAAQKDPATKAKLESMGVLTPEVGLDGFDTFFNQQAKLWSRLVEETGIKEE